MSKLAAKLPALTQQLITYSKPRFAEFLRYAKVELTPPTLGDIPEIRKGIGQIITSAKTGRWRQLTVKEGWLNTLVTVEVLCWFYVGECIGKRKLIGYDV